MSTLNTLYTRGRSQQRSAKKGHLNVGNGHTIYYRTSKCQNPNPQHAVFVHGGPGSCSGTEHLGYFNPEKYCLVQYDQRGCGQSTPFGCLENNSLADLVEDMEKLRQHLGINKWVVFGGSWGALIALRYAQKYPQHTKGIVIWSIYLGDDWIFNPEGAASYYPQSYGKLKSRIPQASVQAFYKSLNMSNHREILPYARDWVTWEYAIMEKELGPLEGQESKIIHRFKMLTHFLLKDTEVTEGAVMKELGNIPEDVIVHILHGKGDFAVSPYTPHTLKEGICHANIHMLDTGHCLGTPDWTHHIVTVADQLASH